jgi:hypothetical protein
MSNYKVAIKNPGEASGAFVEYEANDHHDAIHKATQDGSGQGVVKAGALVIVYEQDSATDLVWVHQINLKVEIVSEGDVNHGCPLAATEVSG